MTTQELKASILDEYDIPLDISDILSICKEFNKLGWQIQTQMESILELGVEEAINTNFVKRESLSHIKYFLDCISKNPYFGDAGDQAKDCIELINNYLSKNNGNSLNSLN